jgi:hypothetical protein
VSRRECGRLRCAAESLRDRSTPSHPDHWRDSESEPAARPLFGPSRPACRAARLLGRYHRAILRIVVLAAVALGLSTAGCGGSAADRVETPDAESLVVRIDDLPAGYTLAPSETGPIGLEDSVEDADTEEQRQLIRAQRVSGFERSFQASDLRLVACRAVVYRSAEAAEQLYSVGQRNVEQLFESGEAEGGPASAAAELGDRSDAYRLDREGAVALVVIWREQNVLSACLVGGLAASDLDGAIEIAEAQQARIEEALG